MYERLRDEALLTFLWMDEFERRYAETMYDDRGIRLLRLKHREGS